MELDSLKVRIEWTPIHEGDDWYVKEHVVGTTTLHGPMKKYEVNDFITARRKHFRRLVDNQKHSVDAWKMNLKN